MRKRNRVYLLAVVAPLFIASGAALLPKVNRGMFGLSSQFWTGFAVGLCIVLAIATIAAAVVNKHDK